MSKAKEKRLLVELGRPETNRPARRDVRAYYRLWDRLVALHEAENKLSRRVGRRR